MINLNISPKNPVVAEHIVDDKPCWPVSAYIAHMIEFCLDNSKSRSWKLRDFNSIQPLFINKDVHLNIEKHDDKLIIQGGIIGVTSISNYAQASYASTVMKVPIYLSIEVLFAFHNQIIALEVFEKWQCESNIVYGESYQLQHKIWSNNMKTSILGLVNVDDCTQFLPLKTSPSLIDTLFQQIGFLAGAKIGRLMPWFIKEIKFSGVLVGPLFAHSTLIECGINSVRGVSRLINMQGEVILELDGIILRTYDQEEDEKKLQGFECTRVVWEPKLFSIGEKMGRENTPTFDLKEVAKVKNLAQKLNNLGKQLIERNKDFDNILDIIGRQSQYVLSGERVDPIQAALWAWYLVARQEFRRIKINLIDIGELEPVIPDISVKLSEYAYRNGLIFQSTFIPAQETVKEPFSAKNCLIIGGDGGLGLVAANVLVNLGAENLWLISRHISEESIDQEVLVSLRARANVHIVACDVSKIEYSLPKKIFIDVIIHAAGIVEDSLIATATEEKICRVLHPKIEGVIAVHRLAVKYGSPKVILFSSIASIDGQAGQSAYAAANAFLDAYAVNCRIDGLPWYSIQWGLWNIGVGIPIASKIYGNEYPFLTAEQGALALMYILSKLPEDTYRVVATLNKDINSASSQLTDTPIKLTDINLNKMKGSEKVQVLLEIIANVLRLEHVDLMDSPTDLGIDSIMAVEIASILEKHGINISPGAFFEVDTIEKLEEHMNHYNDSQLNTPLVINSNDFNRLANKESLDTSIVEPTYVATSVISNEEQKERSFLNIPKKFNNNKVFRKTLPSRLYNITDSGTLDAVIDNISGADRELVAKNEYFYEPVIQQTYREMIKFNQQWYINMASYSYLGLIGHDFIEQAAINSINCFGTGAHGVRLLSGTLTIHRKLEKTIANFFDEEDAIVFSSGYIANIATIASLVGVGDIIIGDTLNHASIVDGCRLSGAEVQRYRHCDMNDLERILMGVPVKIKTRMVVSDAVFSMDGDIAKLPELIQLCQRYGAILMIDEAHSIGVLGATGRGIYEYFNIEPDGNSVRMGTLSKTIPSTGGYVCGSRDLVYALKNNARGWMFSAAITPSQVATATAAFEVIDRNPSLVSQLQERIRFYRNLLAKENLSTRGADTPIVPIMTHTDNEAIKYAYYAQQKGLFVQPITYPTVPRNAPRLRTIVTLDHSIDNLKKAVEIFKYIVEKTD